MNEPPAAGEVRTEFGEEGIVVVKLVGEHDLLTRHVIEDALAGALETAKALIVYVSETTFLDSSAINTLFRARLLLEETGAPMLLQCPREQHVYRLLQLASFLEMVESFDTREEAFSVAHRAVSQ